MSNEKPDVGYVISIQKQSMLTGEVISISTNLPAGALSEEIRKEIDKITQAIDWRIPQPSLDVEQARLLEQGKALDA